MIRLLVFLALCCYIVIRLAQIFLTVFRQWRLIEKIPGPPLKSKICGHVDEIVIPNEGKCHLLPFAIYHLWNISVLCAPMDPYTEVE